jgi:hypothetical protein
MRSLMLSLVAAGVAAGLGLTACEQRVEEAAEPANVTVNPPDNITVVPPASPGVTVTPPDVVVNPPAVVNPPPSKTTESTTVTIPGVGSTTTTTEKR